MPSVYKLNPDADRVSRKLREGFGWYPTSKDNEEQLTLFENSVSRLKKALKGDSKDSSITPSNMRKNLTWVYAISKAEGEKLWEEVNTNLDLYKEMLPDQESCISYAHAIVFALEACFDSYLRNLMSKNDSGFHGAPTHGHGHGGPHSSPLHGSFGQGGASFGHHGPHGPPHGSQVPSQGQHHVSSGPTRSRSREYKPRDRRGDVYGSESGRTDYDSGYGDFQRSSQSGSYGGGMRYGDRQDRPGNGGGKRY